MLPLAVLFFCLRLERLRYRDDLCVRTVSAALGLSSHAGNDIIGLGKAGGWRMKTVGH